MNVVCQCPSCASLKNSIVSKNTVLEATVKHIPEPGGGGGGQGLVGDDSVARHWNFGA